MQPELGRQGNGALVRILPTGEISLREALHGNNSDKSKPTENIPNVGKWRHRSLMFHILPIWATIAIFPSPKDLLVINIIAFWEDRIKITMKFTSSRFSSL